MHVIKGPHAKRGLGWEEIENAHPGVLYRFNAFVL
jgi:hypothetical protein